ncbi:unnamed protein product (macronuclear) [Paramecium tetraurelia]|uniref:Transmembrane protein n=1 Tax=Paramecium tetraurelia TaxID=5888 RepID=A0DRZ2_PARTE|nr:uncharacterized protein GSPATT00019513001 [Paramecium tetraurelia]CAK85809.1 unnamed protein product [Paramecium tetraurelia]|eukprot:XP_001453206.1 hypothetical protein (macronuclear) [Paramecium tetraurelia strain d4-2]
MASYLQHQPQIILDSLILYFIKSCIRSRYSFLPICFIKYQIFLSCDINLQISHIQQLSQLAKRSYEYITSILIQIFDIVFIRSQIQSCLNSQLKTSLQHQKFNVPILLYVTISNQIVDNLSISILRIDQTMKPKVLKFILILFRLQQQHHNFYDMWNRGFQTGIKYQNLNSSAITF